MLLLLVLACSQPADSAGACIDTCGLLYGDVEQSCNGSIAYLLEADCADLCDQSIKAHDRAGDAHREGWVECVAEHEDGILAGAAEYGGGDPAACEGAVTECGYSPCPSTPYYEGAMHCGALE